MYLKKNTFNSHFIYFSLFLSLWFNHSFGVLLAKLFKWLENPCKAFLKQNMCLCDTRNMKKEIMKLKLKRKQQNRRIK